MAFKLMNLGIPDYTLKVKNFPKLSLSSWNLTNNGIDQNTLLGLDTTLNTLERLLRLANAANGIPQDSTVTTSTNNFSNAALWGLVLSSSIGAATQLASGYNDLSLIADTTGMWDYVNSISDVDYGNMSNWDSLANAGDSLNLISTTFDYDTIRGGSREDLANALNSYILSSVGSGASLGSSIGGLFGKNGGYLPQRLYGIGGMLGGVVGGMAMAGIGAMLGRNAIKKGDLRALDELKRLQDAAEREKGILTNNLSNLSINVMKNLRNAALLNLRADGGILDSYNNGVTYIGTGGTHEENPLNGVPMGVAQDGISNLVEEGEVIYNDYVYSARLKVPEKDKESLGLKDNKEYTFADAAMEIQKESEERPNDPNSKRTLEVMMGRLTSSQEELKSKKDAAKFKRLIGKMSPDELLFYMNLAAQTQNAAMPTMQEMVGMLSMLPMESYKNGGMLGREFKKGGKKEGKKEKGKSNIDWENTFETLGKSLRFAPILGSLIGYTKAMSDTPNYSNILRAERAAYATPRITAPSIGERVSYTPIDTEYEAILLTNLGLGNRRAINEYTLGNRALSMNNLLAQNAATNRAIGDARRLAIQQNILNELAAQEFNRLTSQANAQMNLAEQLYNLERAGNIAKFLYETGKLRDAKLAQTLANRSAALSQLFTNTGNLGTDITNRADVKWLAEHEAFGTLPLDTPVGTPRKDKNGGSLGIKKQPNHIGRVKLLGKGK